MAYAQLDSKLVQQLDEEQRSALLSIASGAPLVDWLSALTNAVGRLAPGTRACVLLADEDRAAMGGGYSSHLPPSFIASVRGLPLGEALIGTCGSAIHAGVPVTCPDVEHSGDWAPQWRALRLENDIRACHSHPAIGHEGRALASFFLCLSEPREPNAWERRVAEFGALATSIVVERDRATARREREMQDLSRLQQLSAELVGPGEFLPLLGKILSAAADISETDKGNIQIFDPDKGTLRIVVHQGLGQRLVDHFREDGWDASCGEAARQVQRLVVPDVEKLEASHGTTGLEVVLEDGIRSIQCTPLMSRDGRLLGMLNNHYRRPGGPKPEALRYIDLLARQAAELVERHQVELRNEEERVRKDEFLAMLAHELRNSLAPLRNMLEVQKSAPDNRELMQTACAVMDRQVRHLVRLVDDLLDVNRINKGKLELRLEPLTLQSAISQAVEVCRPLLDQQRHDLQLSLPAEPVVLRGDSARITQVICNLLTNACKYTPAEGRIELKVQTEVNSVRLAVKDNGCGIPHDQLERIFEVFTQVDRTLERAQGGLGIGLMLVRRLVEMHGGTVRAASAGLHQGSEFVVELPLPPLAAASPIVPEMPARKGGLRIMVVDDNRDAAESLALALQLRGHDVRSVFEAATALDVAQNFQPNVILLDIGMPGMSGHEVCRRLRQQAAGRQALIVALTGWGQAEDRHRSREAGFDAHLVKPAEWRALEFLIGEVKG